MIWLINPEDIPAKVNLTNLVSFAIGELKQRIDTEKISTASTSLECKQGGDVDTETEEGWRRRHEKRHEIIGWSYLEMLMRRIRFRKIARATLVRLLSQCSGGVLLPRTVAEQVAFYFVTLHPRVA